MPLMIYTPGTQASKEWIALIRTFKGMPQAQRDKLKAAFKKKHGMPTYEIKRKGGVSKKSKVAKEAKEHPTLPPATIEQIVKDHKKTNPGDKKNSLRLKLVKANSRELMRIGYDDTLAEEEKRRLCEKISKEQKMLLDEIESNPPSLHGKKYCDLRKNPASPRRLYDGFDRRKAELKFEEKPMTEKERLQRLRDKVLLAIASKPRYAKRIKKNPSVMIMGLNPEAQEKQIKKLLAKIPSKFHRVARTNIENYKRFHGSLPLDVTKVSVPKNYPKVIWALGKSDHAVYTVPKHSGKEQGSYKHNFESDAILASSDDEKALMFVNKNKKKGYKVTDWIRG